MTTKPSSLKLSPRIVEVMIDCPDDECQGYMCDVTGDAVLTRQCLAATAVGAPLRCDFCGIEGEMPKIHGFNA